MKTKTEKCLAQDLLSRASVIEIHGYMIHNWILEEFDNFEDIDAAFACSYTDEEGLIYEFEFTKKALMTAAVLDNHNLSLKMLDITGELVTINLFTLVPLKLKE